MEQGAVSRATFEKKILPQLSCLIARRRFGSPMYKQVRLMPISTTETEILGVSFS